jgi:hypothetical protein
MGQDARKSDRVSRMLRPLRGGLVATRAPGTRKIAYWKVALLAGSWPAAVAIAACGSNAKNPNGPGLVDGSVATDAGADAEEPLVDAALDGPTRTTDASDAAPAVPCAPPGGDGGTVYHDITNPSCWSSFDTDGYTNSFQGFFGGAFDGRYVYFTNSITSQDPLVRHDTLADGGSTWASYQGGYDFGGFESAAYDGRYVYFAPGGGGVAVARYDTQAAFASGSSWSSFDLAVPDAGSPLDSGYTYVDYQGAVFDGRYVYLVPAELLSGAANGHVVRYDTTTEFSSGPSWTTFDTTTVAAGAHGFSGGAFDGRYVYLVPNDHGTADAGTGAVDSIATRYDTAAPFASATSWSTFDTTALSPYAAGFSGAAFDGRYVYFAPSAGQGGLFSTVVARVDSQGAFTDASSWSVFDTSPLNADPSFYDWVYTGATFDGRYVYFVPDGGSGCPMLRYDTEAPFSATASWTQVSIINMATNLSTDYVGAVFDGERIYFVPTGPNPVAIFDDRSPRSLPPAPSALPAGYPGSGSFY